MISVVIPTFNAEAALAATLASLVPAVVDGIVREVVVADGGSTDRTLAVVDQAGATLVEAAGSVRGAQLVAGAQRTRHPWLLFLNPGAVLEDGWQREVELFISRVESGARRPSAAVFAYALDDDGLAARIHEKSATARTALFGLPYADQGLLVSTQLYREIGGYRPLDRMEDVDLARRLGRRRVHRLRAKAVATAFASNDAGPISRVTANLTCLAFYFVGLPPPRLHPVRN